MTGYTVNFSHPYPEGGDRVAVHSDIEKLAKSTDAREVQLEQLAVDARFDHSSVPLTASDNLDVLPNGIRSVWSGPTAEALGLPTATPGTVTTIRYGTAAGTQQWLPRAITPQIWQRSELSGWTEWVRVDAGAVENVRMLRTAPSGGFKTAPVALTLGYGGAQTSGTGTTVVVQHMPVTVRRVQLRLANRNPRYTTADSAAVDLSQVAIGRHTGGGAVESWTPLPAATGSTGADGYLSGWLEVPESWQGQDIAVRYTWSGSTVQRNIGTGWTNGSADTTPPLFAWLEVEVPSSTPVVAAFGDSLSSGVSSSRPVVDSWIDQYARTIGAVPVHWSASGDKAAGWPASAQRKWGMYGWDVTAPDALVYFMGSNDLAEASITLEEMQARTVAAVAAIRAQITTTVYGATILPRTNQAPGSTFETVRRQVNAWLPRSGLFRDVFGFATAISNDDETILPEFDADGVHLNTAGYAALAAAIDSPIVGGGADAAIAAYLAARGR